MVRVYACDSLMFFLFVFEVFVFATLWTLFLSVQIMEHPENKELK